MVVVVIQRVNILKTTELYSSNWFKWWLPELLFSIKKFKKNINVQHVNNIQMKIKSKRRNQKPKGRNKASEKPTKIYTEVGPHISSYNRN